MTAGGELIVLSPGQVLFEEGDVSGGLFFVKEGKLDIFRLRDGMEVMLGSVSPGDVLGTLTVFSKEPRTASARASVQSTVMKMSSQTLANAIKTVPPWALALMKDAVSRLKYVDHLLVESKLSEKKLAHKIGNTFHHAAQISSLLAGMSKIGLENDDGIELFPLKGFVWRAEQVILIKGEYIEKIIDIFSKGNLIKIVQNAKYGTGVFQPKCQLLEDFAVYSLNIAKMGTKDFVPIKFNPYMIALTKIHQKSTEKESWKISDLAEALSKEMAKRVAPSFIDELIINKIVRPKTGTEDEVLFSMAQLQRKMIFEGICKALEELKQVD